MSAAGYGESGGGWKKNPLIGGIAAVAVLLFLLFGPCGPRCRRRIPSPIEGDTITMICPHCNEVYKVKASDVGLGGVVDEDQLQAKAAAVPCPECGKKDSVMASFCPHCGRPFAAPRTGLLKDVRCPHCGKSPWAR